MKKPWVWIVIILVIILGYFGRHKIRAMLGGSSAPAPVTQTETTTSTPAETMTPSSASASLTMTKTDPTKGSFLTDSKGMTLYIFDKDTSGVSTCTGGCAATWPPFSVSSPAPSPLPSTITTIKRADGSMQYAYKGMPLYYYSKDTKSGDMLGDGVGGVWHLAKP